MNEREYRRLREQLDAEYKKNLEALERVWKMARNGEGPDRDEVMPAVREAISTINGPAGFTIRDLRAANPVLADAKQSSISTALMRLKDEEIEVVSKGRGRAATRYRKKVRPEEAER